MPIPLYGSMVAKWILIMLISINKPVSKNKVLSAWTLPLRHDFSFTQVLKLLDWS
jgi:hypothetical protein